MTNETTTQPHVSQLEMEPEPQQAMAVPPPRPPTPPPSQAPPRQVNEPRREPPAAPAFLEYSVDVGELITALCEATLEFEDIVFDRNARIQSQKANYAYNWASLAAIRKATEAPLAKHGLKIMHGARPNSNSALTVRTTLFHKSGQWVRNDLPVGLFGPDPQEVGKAISYARRYNIQALLNLSASDEEDDDGASAATAARTQAPPQAAPRPSQRPAPPPPQERPAQEAEPSGTAPTVQNVGLITELGQRGGAWFVMLDTGYRAATKDNNLGEALVKARAGGERVELSCRAPRDPAYAPTLEEIAVIKG